MVNLTCGPPTTEATECDVVERDGWLAAFDGDRLVFYMRPREIRTFRVRLLEGNEE
jgi:hypothetical protein